MLCLLDVWCCLLCVDPYLVLFVIGGCLLVLVWRALFVAVVCRMMNLALGCDLFVCLSLCVVRCRLRVVRCRLRVV